MSATVEDVVIVGAGVAGLATAVALKRAGIEALVLERADQLRASGAALSLFPNAWFALDALGVSHKLIGSYTPTLTSFTTDVQTGEVLEVPLPKPPGKIAGPIPVHRKALLETLANELSAHAIRFSSKISAIETQEHEGTSIAIVHTADGAVIKAKILIGCDGVHSVVARWLGLSELAFSGRSVARGVSVYPQGHGQNVNCLQQYVGSKQRRIGVIPLTDTDIYWYFSVVDSSEGISLAEDPKDIQKEILEKYGNDLPPLILDVVQHTDLPTLSWAPLKYRYPWKVVFGNLCKQNITVAGDAMHPMTPDLGQGGCSSLEDAVILGRHIGKSFIRNGNVLEPKEISQVLQTYVDERKWRVSILIAAAYISGGIQQAKPGRVMRFVRDTVFFKLLFPVVAKYLYYDCGKLDF